MVVFPVFEPQAENTFATAIVFEPHLLKFEWPVWTWNYSLQFNYNGLVIRRVSV